MITPILYVRMYVGAEKPTIKLLMKYRGEIAPHWRDVGTQLLQEKYCYKLDVIQEDHPNDVEKCCDKMFKHWLSVDVEANWNKLIDALLFIQQNAIAARVKQDVLIGKVI